jgi:hypothetical protein
MNKEVSNLVSTNPKEVMYVVNRLYQARGAYFSTYKDLLRRQTQSGLRRINKFSRLAAVHSLREGAM